MKLMIHIEGQDEPVVLKGRTAWALEQVQIAGAMDVGTVERRAPRWRACVHKLRGKGIHVDTTHEKRGGPFPGVHGRYKPACVMRVEAA